MIEDNELLRRYAEEKSETAFAGLVERRLGFVYACALRRVGGDAHLAEDVAQQVFVALAREARVLGQRETLTGWFFTTTRFISAQCVRTERRRHAREQEAFSMNETSPESSAPADWERLRPVLDGALDELDERDREAVLLRFFEQRSFAEVGVKLQLTENAARMRVERALDKLHGRLAGRGVTSTSAALGLALASHASVATPAGLAASVTGAALAGGGGVAAVAAFMSITKLQVGIASALALAGAAGFVAQARSNTALQAEVAGLRQESAAIGTLRVENARLTRAMAEVADLRRDDVELARLRDEAVALKAQVRKTENLAAAAAMAPADRQPAMLTPARPAYPEQLKIAGVQGEVVVDFIVDTNGVPRQARAVKSALIGINPAAKPDESASVVTLNSFPAPGAANVQAAGKSAAGLAASGLTEAQAKKLFEEAAIEAVNKWSFSAGQRAGRPVNTHMQLPIVFSQEDKE